MESAKAVYQATKDFFTDFTKMSREEAYNHLSRVYGDDKDDIAAGLKMWDEANKKESRGRSASASSEKP